MLFPINFLLVARKRRSFTAFCAAILVLWGVRRAMAGNGPVHLTGTQFIASYVNFPERTARFIANASWNLDLNRSTVATPRPGATSLETAANLLDMAFRQQMWHSIPAPLSSKEKARLSPQEQATRLTKSAQSHLNMMAAEVNRTKNPSTRAIFLGQYLHALQDHYFHFDEDKGAPYVSVRGHFSLITPAAGAGTVLTGNLWSADTMRAAVSRMRDPGTSVDSPAERLGATVKAYEATYRVLDAVAGGNPVPPFNEIGVSPGRLRKHELREMNPDMVTLGRAMHESYHQHTTTATTGDVKATLGNKLKSLAVKFSSRPTNARLSLATYVPLLQAKKFDYDNHPEFVMFSARRPQMRVDETTHTVKGIGTDPGGISLTAAAAARLPIDIDINSVHYDEATGTITLSGSPFSGATHNFDASILVTALRLAARGEDPYFSLDPDDYKEYQKQSSELINEVLVYLEHNAIIKHQDVRRVIRSTVDYSVESRNLEEHAIDRYGKLLKRYPSARPLLVFHPRWLGETRFGAALYHADVVLKELASGLPATTDSKDICRVQGVAGYKSPVYRDLAFGFLQLLGNVQHQQDSGENVVERKHGLRFWFDLGSDLPANVVLPQLPELPTVPRSAPIRDRVINRVLWKAAHQLNRVHGDTSITYSGRSDRTLRYAQGICDVSTVLPRMSVRHHKNGHDVPGTDPYMGILAADVNARFPEYAKRYPELVTLNQLCRAYVAACRLIEQDDGLRNLFASTELTTPELLDEPLPDRHPTPLIALHQATLDCTIRYRENGQLNMESGRIAQQNIVSISGGVVLAYQSLKKAILSPWGREKAVRSITSRPTGAVIWHADGNTHYRFEVKPKPRDSR